MNKTMTITLLTCALLTSASVLAKDRGRDRKGPPPGGSVLTEMVEHTHHALKQLELTEEQKAAIRGEFQSMRTEAKPLLEELRDNRAALHEQLIARDYDAAAVGLLAEQQGDLTAKLLRLGSASVHAALGHLTDEQRARLGELREERRDRLQEQLGQLQKRLERMDGDS